MDETWNKVLINFQDGATLTVGHILTAVAIFLVGLVASAWISRLIARYLGRNRMSPDTAVIIRKLTFIFLMVITVLTTLGFLKVPLTSFTFLSGAIAIGAGFGAQNIINNFISGWILMSERPVRIGDFIEIEDSKGVVEVIGNRSTQIRRVDGVHIMVPNSMLMERVLVNWTLIDRQIRTTVRVGVAYGSPVRDVERLFKQALAEHHLILQEPEPVIEFNDFGDSALIFDALFWANLRSGERELRMIRSDIRYRIDELFRENGITIAFPQMDLHMKSWEAGTPLVPTKDENA
ncbi:MAG: mechanosensitive ion channel [Gammaproteobacteria bacterium]|nr:mechanosensitive ion channel [Gammaproteobacteria bacterium]